MNDRVLRITGARRGIGAAKARLAARTGWAVAVNDAARREASDAVVRDIEAAGGVIDNVSSATRYTPMSLLDGSGGR